MVIGSDYYHDIITGEIRRGVEGACAVSSKFGWLIYESADARNLEKVENVVNFVAEWSTDVSPYSFFVEDENDDLLSEVKKFLNTESTGIK